MNKRRRNLYRISNKQGVIADRVRIADGFFARLWGLQGKKELNEGEGLLIRPCRQIHTFNMRFSLDVLFLSEEGIVVHIVPFLGENAISEYIRAAYQVVELRSGTLCGKNVSVGEKITIE